MFAIHFFILVCFLIPYGLRTAYWVSVSTTQGLTAEAVNRFEAKLRDITASPDLSAASDTHLVELVLQSLKKVVLCEGCREVPLWQILLGMDQGLQGAALPIALLLYNLCRALLTWRVSLLRDEEERSGFAPALDEYARLKWLHRTYSVLIMVAGVSLVWHIVNWLTLPILIRA
jgi:hypothetical protein